MFPYPWVPRAKSEPYKVSKIFSQKNLRNGIQPLSLKGDSNCLISEVFGVRFIEALNDNQSLLYSALSPFQMSGSSPTFNDISQARSTLALMDFIDRNCKVPHLRSIDGYPAFKQIVPFDFTGVKCDERHCNMVEMMVDGMDDVEGVLLPDDTDEDSSDGSSSSTSVSTHLVHSSLALDGLDVVTEASQSLPKDVPLINISTTPIHSPLAPAHQICPIPRDDSDGLSSSACVSTDLTQSISAPAQQLSLNPHLLQGDVYKGSQRLLAKTLASISQLKKSSKPKQGSSSNRSRPQQRPRQIIQRPPQQHHRPQQRSKTKGSFTDEEHYAIYREIKGFREEEIARGIERKKWLRDVAFFTAISNRLAEYHNIDRTHVSCKNYWNRFGRKRSGYDERVRPSSQLSTSVQ